MYRVIDFVESAMTRRVCLLNLNSGTIEECFDDSALVSREKNFDFMVKGKEYDCKIQLLGDFTSLSCDRTIVCEVIDREVVIGNTLMLKVKNGEDVYYVRKSVLNENEELQSFRLLLLRKNLCQVDNVVHSDFI